MKKQAEKYILMWLRLIARLQIKKNKPTIIGVTGSAGKTSTVKAIGEVLKTKHSVKCTLKGNSETGIPLELLGIPIKNYTGLRWIGVILLSIWQVIFYWPKYELLIVEMGIDSDQIPKNMTYLLKIIKPMVGIFLNVNNVHGANFSGKDTIKAITTEKGKLLSSLPENGLAIFSADHPSIVNLEKNIRAKKKKFSINQHSDMQLLKYDVSLNGTKFIFLAGGKQFVLNLANQVHFKEAFGGFASALLAGEYFGVNIEDGVNALEKRFKLLPGRMTVLEGINNSVILDSSYNSSLEPTSATLRMLNKISARGKKIAILGDMREIGKQEKQDHEKLAEVVAKNADEVILVGPLTAKYILPKLKKLKFAKTKIHSFITSYEALGTVKKIIEPHDLILVKGSQNTIFLEIIVKAIMAHPEQASKILCRQTRYWERQRKQLI
ncbi:MAG: Mur ligase family protein [Patescibacteria group bacterium]